MSTPHFEHPPQKAAEQLHDKHKRSLTILREDMQQRLSIELDNVQAQLTEQRPFIQNVMARALNEDAARQIIGETTNEAVEVFIHNSFNRQ